MPRLNAKQTSAVTLALDEFEATVRAAMRAALLESRQGGVEGGVHDLGEEAIADELAAVNSTLAERHGQELLQAVQARLRLVEGSAGICTECDGAIGYPRLLANPVALRCVSCETRHEHTPAHAAMPRL